MNLFFYAEKGETMLKGVTTFELTNVKTGEVEKIVDENMFTNALREIYKRPPFGFMNPLFGAVEGTGATLHPVNTTTLGGLLLFPNPIEENADNIFATSDNKPTGIASVLDNPATDPRRGSFNAIESGKLSNGFKYVYDFSTSQGNGPISCCCLTSAWGGATYLDDVQNFLCGIAIPSEYSPAGNYKTILDDNNSKHKVIGANSRGIFYLNGDGTYKKIDVFPINPYSVLLVDSYTKIETLGTMDEQGFLFVASDYIGCVRTAGNASGNATVYIDKYSIDDFSKTTVSYTVPAPLSNGTKNETRGHVVPYDEENDYLYLMGYDGTSFYKVKLSNTADVTRIEVPSSWSDLSNCKPYFVGQNFILEDDDTVNKSPVTLHNSTMARIGLYAIGGVWNWATNTSSYQSIVKKTSCNPIGTYLATINNLKNTVVKTSDKTMKVTYTVTEV